MTNEQREAIEDVEEFVNKYDCGKFNDGLKLVIFLAKEQTDSIPTQVVIDKIKELKLSGGSDGKDNVENLVRELTIDILQELLEGERK